MSNRKIDESDQGVTKTTPFEQRDLFFNSAFVSRPLLPLSIDVPCVVCGTIFQNFLRRGRPQLFCSDPCRDKQSRQQRNAWGRRRTAAKHANQTCGENHDV